MRSRYLLNGLLLLAALALPLASRTAAQAPPPNASGPARTVWQIQQKGIVRSVAYSPDGKLLASGSHDNTVKLWEAGTGQPVRSFEGHTDSVRGVAFSPDGKLIASGSADKTVRIWNAQTGAALHTLQGHTDKVRSVAFSPDGLTLASGSDDKSVRLWDARTGQPGKLLSGHGGTVWRVAFSPDGKLLASGGGESDKTGAVRLWNAASGQPVRTLKGHTNEVWSVAFSPDGRTLASVATDYTLKLWDAPSGALLRSLSESGPIVSLAFAPDGGMLAIGGFTLDGAKLGGGVVKLRSARTGRLYGTLTGPLGPVLSVAFSPDSKSVASASGYESPGDVRPGEVRVWQVEGVAGLMARGDNTPELALQLGHNDVVEAVAFSTDGALMATGGGTLPGEIKLWDARTGELRRTLTGTSLKVRAIAFSPDGRLLASGSGTDNSPHALGELQIWDGRTGSPRLSLPGHTKRINGVAFSPDGKTLASASSDKSVRLWDPETGEPRRTLGGHGGAVHSVRFSPVNPAQLATASADGTVKLWDTATGAVLLTLQGHAGAVNGVAFSPDGKLLASSGADKTVRLWDAQTGAAVHTLAGHPEEADGIVFSPDGRLLASGSGTLTDPTPSGEVRLWDVRTRALVKALPTGTHLVPDVTFSPDGRTLAGGGGSIKSGEVLLWDAATGALHQKLGGQRDFVLSVAVSPDGKTIASGVGTLEKGAVQLWDLQSGTLRQTLAGHTSEVTSVAYSSDGALLASGSWDGTIKLWNPANGALLRTLGGHTGLVNAIALSRDGMILVSGSVENGKGGEIRVWDTGTGQGLRTLTGHTKEVNGVAVSPDGATVASAGADATVRLWNVRTGALERTLTGHVGHAWGVVFSPDGQTLASSGADPSTGTGSAEVKLWDVATGALRSTIQSAGVLRSVAYSPDGKRVAGQWVDLEDGRVSHEIRLWNAQTGAVVGELAGHEADVASIAFTPDGSRIVTGSADNTVRVWDAATTRLLATCLSLPAGEGPKPIAVGAKPIVLGAKPIVLGAKPIVLGAKDVSDVEYLTFTPEGYYAGSAAADRYVRFRFGEDLFPAESFQARYYRPDLVKQSLAGAELPVVSAFQGPYPPVIGFTSHQDGAKVKGGTLSVTVEATDDQGVNSVALFVNGARVDAKPLLVGSKPIVLGAKPIVLGAKAVPATHRVTRTYTVAVPLPPNETTVWVQAIAFDGDQLQSPREEILFTQDKTAAATGRLLGLCVGVSRYADAALNLQYADKDATTLAEELNKQRGIYKTAEVTPLANDQATRDGVKAALDGLVGKATRADTVILFLSGHGWRSDERSFYFATHEVNRANVAATALPWSEVVERLARLSERSKRVIVLLDACHSGSAANNEELVKGVLSANAGVMVFASSKGSEVSLESPELMHGVFTKALLEGISGRATPPDEKQVTVLDFLAYVARRVKTLTNDTQHPHIPFLQDFETDSALVTVTTAAAQ